MNISFKKSPLVAWLTLAEIVIGIGIVITESLLGYYWLGTFTCIVLPIIAFVVLAIGTFIDFKDSKTKNILYVAGLVACGIALCTSMSTSFSKMLLRLSVVGLQSKITYTINIIASIIFAIAHIFFILLIVTYGIYVFSKQEKKDIWNIVKVSVTGLLATICVLAVFELVIHFFSVTSSYSSTYVYEYYPYIVTELFSAALIFLIVKSSYFELAVSVKKNQNTNFASNTSSISIADEMKKTELIRQYKELLDNGVITQEEFQKKKDELMK